MAGYTENELAKDLADKEYQYGFVSDIDSDVAPAGLTEQIIHLISSKKNEPSWLLDYRLKAFEVWKTMKEPDWAHVSYKKPDFQAISYYAAPKQTKKYESWDDVDPEMKETMSKLGISLEEQQRLTGVAVDFVMDSVSVGTSFKAKLAELGIIFCSFSEAVKEHPELVKKYIDKSKPLVHLSVDGSWTAWALSAICEELGIEFYAAHPDSKKISQEYLGMIKEMYPKTNLYPIRPNMMQIMYNSLKKDAREKGWQMLPYAFDHDFYKDYLADRIQPFVHFDNLVVSSGSGVTLSGLAKGYYREELKEFFPQVKRKIWTTCVSSVSSINIAPCSRNASLSASRSGSNSPN